MKRFCFAVRYVVASALCVVPAFAGAQPVTGRVLFDGPLPEKKPLAIVPEQSKGCCPDGTPMDTSDPSWVVAADGALANVVLTVEVAGSKAPVPERPIEIDQRGCVFEPHVMIVPAGAQVAFLNSDTVNHNVRGVAAKNDSFNKTVAPGGKEIVTLASPDKVSVRCDLHPWMSSWIFVTDTPFHALTAKDGTFRIEGLAPGTYKVKLWHEKLGRGEGEVTIRPDGSSEPATFKMAEKKKKGA
jgi:plastocyanin